MEPTSAILDPSGLAFNRFEWILVAVGAAVAVLVVARLLRWWRFERHGELRLANRRQRRGKLEARQPLYPSEQILYWHLCESLPEHVVLPRVDFHRFLRRRGSSGLHALRTRLARRSIADGLICTKDFHVVAVVMIETDTPDPEGNERDALLRQAGIRSLRLRLDNLPRPEGLAKLVAGLERLRAFRAEPGPKLLEDLREIAKDDLAHPASPQPVEKQPAGAGHERPVEGRSARTLDAS